MKFLKRGRVVTSQNRKIWNGGPQRPSGQVPRALEPSAEQKSKMLESQRPSGVHGTGVGAVWMEWGKLSRCNGRVDWEAMGVAPVCFMCNMYWTVQWPSGLGSHGRCTNLFLVCCVMGSATGERKEGTRALLASAPRILGYVICNGRVEVRATGVAPVCPKMFSKPNRQRVSEETATGVASGRPE